MENKEIIITVAGKYGSGSSRIVFLLKKFLREQGFDVELDLKSDIDYFSERKFDLLMNDEFDKAIEYLKKVQKITIGVKQLPRTWEKEL